MKVTVFSSFGECVMDILLVLFLDWVSVCIKIMVNYCTTSYAFDAGVQDH